MSNRTKDAPAAPERRQALASARSDIYIAVRNAIGHWKLSQVEVMVLLAEELKRTAENAMVEEWEEM